MITTKEYCSITRRTGDFLLPNITFEEAQDFLISLGYKILIHKGKAKVCDEVHEFGEVRRVGTPYDAECSRVCAIKDDAKLSERVDSDESAESDIGSVFRKEIKRKLLGL